MREPFIVTGESAEGHRASYGCAHADDALSQAHAMSKQGFRKICIVDGDDCTYEVSEFEKMTNAAAKPPVSMALMK
jgi:hypothetical protein